MPSLSTLSSFTFTFNESIERTFLVFKHPETLSNHHYITDLFKITSIQKHPLKIFHITLTAFQYDTIEIQNIHMCQDSNFSTLTNLVTKLNGKSLQHPIWIEYKFFFNSCVNNTFLIIENKIDDCNVKLESVLQELISNKFLYEGCQSIKEYLLQINKNIIHAESVLILRPLTQIWKCIKTCDFWKLIYKENKYTFRVSFNGENKVFIIINNVTNTETSYKIKKTTLLNDRISLRLVKQSNSKNSIKKYISISILSISQIACFMTLETEIFSSVNLDFLCLLSQYQQCFLKTFKLNVEKLPCES